MALAPQPTASGTGIVPSVLVLYQRTQANVVITLFVVGLLLALTTLVLNFTSPHVNAIITVGSFSALSFVGALIAWVMMSKTSPPPTEARSAVPVPAKQERASSASRDTSRQPQPSHASVIHADGAPASALAAIVDGVTVSATAPIGASAEEVAPIEADSAPAAAAAAVAPQAAAESTPWEDKYAPLYDKIFATGEYHGPSEEASITEDLEHNESGLSYLDIAVLTGDKNAVEGVSKRLPKIFVQEDDPLKQYQMPVSQIQDKVEGLTPLHLIGHYLMLRWKHASSASDKAAIQGNAELMLQHLRFVLLKNSSNDDIGMEDVKDPKGRKAKAYFEEVLAPNAPEDLATLLHELASKLKG